MLVAVFQQPATSAAYHVHPTALVETQAVGGGTHVGAFVHVLAGARIGRDCDLGDHIYVDSGVWVGDRVTVKSGAQLWSGAHIEDDVFIGANATFTEDPGPGNTVVKRGANIGANATILRGVTIDEHVIVEAGAVVSNNVPRNAIVTGNPARIVGYAGVLKQEPDSIASAPAAGISKTNVEGVTLHRLPLVNDLRGMLSFGEVGREVPFPVKRYFLVFDVATEQIRGEHAHRTLHQFLICVHGRCALVADDGQHRQEFLLDSPTVAVYIPPMVWAVQYKYSTDGVLLALASGEYDPGDYIRDYSEYLSLKQALKEAARRD